MAEATAVRRVITIKSIQKKMKHDGTTPFWNITENSGDFYSVFDPTVEARLAEGQHAVMVEEVERNGKTYRNIVGIADPMIAAGEVSVQEIVPGGTPVMETKPQQSRPLNVVNNMLEVRIAALNATATLLATGSITASKVEAQTKQFEQYLLHGWPDEQKSSSAATDGADQFIDQ